MSLQKARVFEGLSNDQICQLLGKPPYTGCLITVCFLRRYRSGSFSAGEIDVGNVYPLQLRLVLLQESNSSGIKISKKDNAIELYKRACKIFNVESEPMSSLSIP